MNKPAEDDEPMRSLTPAGESVSWRDRYMKRFYDREKGWRNGTEEFHDLCRTYVPQGGKILEIGAGPSNATSRFLASLGLLQGVDIDPAVLGNEFLTAAHVVEKDAYPYPDETFDACISDYVLEHVAEPRRHLAEIRRVLKPGGVYAFRTPNRFHYVAFVSRLTSHRFHLSVANRSRNLPAGSHDPYPTVYACNSRRAVRELVEVAGLEIALLRMVEKEPSYGMFSPIAFLPLMLYERIVNASRALEGMRANIFCVLRKPHSSE